MISFQSAAMKNQLAIGRPIFEEDLNFPAAQFQKLELSPILLSNQLETIQKSAEVSKKTLGREAKLFRVRTLRIIASRTESRPGKSGTGCSLPSGMSFAGLSVHFSPLSVTPSAVRA
jgi:hypothetical protein